MALATTWKPTVSWGGLYCLPIIEQATELQQIEQQFKLQAQVSSLQISHGFTHFTWILHEQLFHVEHDQKETAQYRIKWSMAKSRSCDCQRHSNRHEKIDYSKTKDFLYLIVVNRNHKEFVCVFSIPFIVISLLAILISACTTTPSKPTPLLPATQINKLKICV